MVTGQDVADFLGLGDDPALVALAGEVVPIITAMARSYTRDRGFTGILGTEPADDIAAVIVTASARMVANPQQTPYDIGSVSQRGGFTGWTLPETYVLNRYRVRAQ